MKQKNTPIQPPAIASQTVAVVFIYDEPFDRIAGVFADVNLARQWLWERDWLPCPSPIDTPLSIGCCPRGTYHSLCDFMRARILSFPVVATYADFTSIGVQKD